MPDEGGRAELIAYVEALFCTGSGVMDAHGVHSTHPAVEDSRVGAVGIGGVACSEDFLVVGTVVNSTP